MFERFTGRARRVVVLAQDEACDLKHNCIGTEHLLLSLITEDEGATAKALEMTEVKGDAVRTCVIEIIGEGEKAVEGHIPFTPRAKRVFELSLHEAFQLGHNYIGTEHLLLGLLKEGKGVAAQVLTKPSADLSQVRETVIQLLSGHRHGEDEGREFAGAGIGGTGGPGRQSSAVLEQFGRNLTQAVRENKLDPVIGRQTEMKRVMQILSHRTKDNPVLIGEPGVGKTAVVEGLAQAIVSGDVPETIKDRQIYGLDMGSLMAGSRYCGGFEEYLKKVLREIHTRGNTILSIDEIHTLVGAGAAEGSIDATQMLKPILTKGELQTIGAITNDEYRKYIEKDAALKRRFQPVKVDRPSVEEIVEILKGLRDRYETHHRIIITDQAITAAAELVDRYISDRFLPDKAIDLVDETGARLRIRRMIASPELCELDEGITEVRRNRESTIDDQDLEKVAALRDEEMKLGGTRKAKEAAWKGTESDEIAEVGEEEIAEVLTMSTGIPVFKLTQTETTKLLNMGTELHKRVIDQDEAVKALSQSIRRTRSGLKDPNRPGDPFIFAGPAGVGKTELAKALAEFLFGDEDALTQLDMSEFSEEHTASRLFGAPPGYVSYDEDSQLTERIRRKPFSVILFNEVGKAHPDVFNSLLQILEEGRFIDPQGREVDFRNTVIIMTTNLSTRDINKGVLTGFQSADNLTHDYAQMKSKVNEELKQHFRPEFLNRVDDTIVFPSLGKDEIKQTIDPMVARLAKCMEAQDIRLQLSDEVRRLLADLGLDPALGACPLRCAIQRKIEDALPKRILFGEVQPGQLVLVGVEGEGKEREFTFSAQQ